MNEQIDPREVSIDGLIDWLGTQRRRDPSAPLSKLLTDHSLDQQRLVDVACIDLMQRRRMSHAVTVEDYLSEFPGLESESNLLDLIDAELCIKTELGEPIDVDEYVRRFPAYADPVRELISLEAGTEAKRKNELVELADVRPMGHAGCNSAEKSVDQSDDFSIDIAAANARESSRQLESWSEHPLDVPEWFIGSQCVARSPGKWLIRGRDSVRGIPLALKVTELPVQVTDVQIKQILDACECAANIGNSNWVAPRIAAVQNRHLGVIRPWLFSRPWRDAGAGDRHSQLRHLASVAFAIQSAHRSGATHGGLHADNLMMEHDGSVRIMDAATSQLGLQRWLSPTHDTSSAGRDVTSRHENRFASLDERKSIDVQDLIRLVATAAVDWDPQWSNDLVAQLRATTSQGEDTCAEIGQILLRHADSNPRSGGSHNGRTNGTWRRRLAHWLTKND